MRIATLATAVGLMAQPLACHSPSQPAPQPVPRADQEEAPKEVAPQCAPTRPAGQRLVGVTEEHERADYWLELTGERFDLDQELLSPADVARLNASMQVERSGFHAQQDLLAEVDAAEQVSKIEGRLQWLRDQISSGELEASPAVLASLTMPEGLRIAPELRVALAPIQIYCAPTAEKMRDAGAVDDRIDKNHCSSPRAQEVVQVLGKWSDELLLARTAYSWGFIAADSPLSPPVEDKLAASFVGGATGTVRVDQLVRDTSAGQVTLPRNTRLPLSGARQRSAHVATATGFATIKVDATEVSSDSRPLTRRALLEEAFVHLGAPYGFGGGDGGQDCSRFLLDVFASFGLALPRHTAWQARAGSFRIDVTGMTDADKLRLADTAADKGAVLLHLPGHIMLYLGRDRSGRPMVIHALAHYLERCPDESETSVLVDRVSISDLSLGEGSSKTSLLQRIDGITVFGGFPGADLAGATVLRPAAPVRRPSASECRKVPGGRLFVSPKKPLRGRPVRVVASSPLDLGAVRITLFDPSGQRVEPDLVRTGGPPFGYIATADASAKGRWTAVLGDGDRLRGCRNFYVSVPPRSKKKPAADEPEPVPEGPIWEVRDQWGPITEDLYSIFVERLFDYSPDADVTWPNLHTLLRDRDRNIFYDYFGLDEENQLKLVPDCADLPYVLRAYFAWKLGLPYGVHDCRRARNGRAPSCVRAVDNLLARAEIEQATDLGAFARFVNQNVRNTVHSSSGRTAPKDENTDFYPVELSRKTLRPGTLFTDPYGHLLIIADWVPQGPSGYGTLIGADAQPDGTVGRRRFWRGSFLFRPETRSGGAGFKAFRPWVYDKETETLVLATNDELKTHRVARISMQQYRGTMADFYDRMQALINPRPLDPMMQLTSLVDALEEQVSRRVTSVENGEKFMREHSWVPIEMPEGEKIFLTSGPWEDFSTPSRDWRLLIAIDTVLDFPDAVRRAPEQYRVEPAQAQARSDELRAVLAKELAARAFTYQRSDGSSWKLTLKDVVDRRVGFEMAYNPNDCVEQRWAATEGSAERATCKRSAPDEQRARMQEHRAWFAERSRPAL